MKTKTGSISASLALLLALLFVFAAASCAKQPDTPAEQTTVPAADTSTEAVTAEPETTEINAKNLLGARDFDKKTVCFYSSVYNGAWISDLFHEENDGDVLGSAVFRRNEIIKSEYNVELTEKESGTRTFSDKLAVQVKANDPSFNLVYMGLADASNAAVAGSLIDIKRLSNINLDGAWWNSEAAAAWSIVGKLYYATGDITTTDNMSIRMMYFNKDRVKDLKLQSPYDMVGDNTWTFENYFIMVEAAGADAGGDGVTISDDDFGVVAQTTFPFMMTTASGEMLTFKDGNDSPVCIADGDYSRLIDVADYLTDHISGHPAVYLGADADIMSIFTSGRSLFMAEVLLHCKTMRMNYDVNFGLMPMPKYNADQQCYYQYFTGYCTTTVGVPFHIQDEELDMVSFILEAMAIESVNTVTPAYSELCMKGRYVDDYESAGMIDIITGVNPIGKVSSDLAEVYGWGGLKSTVQDTIASGQSISGSLTSLNKATKAAIARTVKSIAALP
ncbi:MAG: hypothetical protein ILO42_09790 [Clostridia bacterium]|nr:hypothetical protein [Clostridia bacterium]MBP5271234.1 hypothetical protein [Clostridia bacterium]